MTFIDTYLEESIKLIEAIDKKSVEAVVKLIVDVRNNNGRIFFLGCGGGAGNANHAVNDFRKIAGIESYAVTDNASELTARINDEGWDSCFSEWLKVSRINKNDLVFVFSVGGGNIKHKLSMNIVNGMKLAKEAGAAVTGIVGRDGGETATLADAVVLIPSFNPENVTALTESFQGLIWHLIVTHPAVKQSEMRWESVK